MCARMCIDKNEALILVRKVKSFQNAFDSFNYFLMTLATVELVFFCIELNHTHVTLEPAVVYPSIDILIIFTVLHDVDIVSCLNEILKNVLVNVYGVMF
jgi:hypothetical protein